MKTSDLLKIGEHDGMTVASIQAETLTLSELETVASLLRNYILQKRPDRLILDFSRLRFLSSMMLGLLVDTWRRLKDYGGRMRICGLQPNLMRVFRVTHLDRIFEFSPDCDDALEAFRQNS